ncbi:Uncharacterised protein [Serratia fonticola]|uniref:hypothetical protein n=1 Tax=Serratia fonticola TaxID=47917 RepID=UPI0021837E2A|nr:hypothetical protein [Serratia fonticola]CAI2078970.1 Uncharacterised protein [Serratia fonticola]
MNNNMIYWRGVCIGEMINPIVDNFDVFGKWKQNGNANEQASLIKEIEDNEEAYICSGGRRFWQDAYLATDLHT